MAGETPRTNYPPKKQLILPLISMVGTFIIGRNCARLQFLGLPLDVSLWKEFQAVFFFLNEPEIVDFIGGAHFGCSVSKRVDESVFWYFSPVKTITILLLKC